MHHTCKKLLALLLALMMCISLLPAAYAEGGPGDEEEQGMIQPVSGTEPGEEPEPEPEIAETPGEIRPADEAEPEAQVPEGDEIQAEVSSGQCGDDLTWTLDENGTLTISGKGDMWNFSWGGPWSSGRSVTAAVIEPGVTSIGDYAFTSCGALAEVTIPEGVTRIGTYAFSHCQSLTVLRLPASLQELGFCMSSYCSGLQAYEVDPDNPYFCSVDGFLFNKAMTELLYGPDGFRGAYTVPDGVTSLGSHFLCGTNGITAITIPSSVTSIGTWALQSCAALESITVAEDNPSFCSVDGVLYTKDLDTLRRIPGAKAGVISVAPGVKTIAFQAGLNCDNLTEVILPEGLVRIDSEAFCDCIGVTRFTIPASLKEIGTRGLRCPNLREVQYGGTMAQWRQITIEGENSAIRKANVICSDGVLYDGDKCGDDLDWSFDASTGILSIAGTGDMWGFDWMEAPWSSLASQIRQVEIASGVTSIGENAFVSCEKLRSVSIPEGLTRIGMAAFEYCSSLRAPELPETLTEISGNAFAYCTSLQFVTIPQNVRYINWNAFNGCSDLSGILFRGSAPYFGESCFLGVTATAYYPDDDDSWTDSARQSYGGLITWSPYGEALEILSQPRSVAVKAGDQASFTVKAVGKDLSYKWYYRTSESGEWTAVKKNGTAPTYTLTVLERHDGYQYRCQVSNPASMAYSEVATLRISNRTVIASGECGGDLTWALDDEGLLTVSGTGSMWEFGWYGSPWNDNRFDIRTVEIEEGVTGIGAMAFLDHSNLSAVTISGSVTTIGQMAFYGCDSLADISIPAAVVDIRSGAFTHCRSMTEIRVAEDNPAFSSQDGVLYNKARTELVCCPAGKSGTLIVPTGVTAIVSEAFSSCRNLQSVLLPEGLTRIENWAFMECIGLTSIRIPASVTSIEQCVFGSCTNLTEIEVAEENRNYTSVDGVLYNKAGTELICCPGGKSGTLELPEGTTVICSEAFSGCGRLSSVVLPESLQRIEGMAFNQCSGLSDIRIPAGVTYIEPGAFICCYNLTEFQVAEENTSYSARDGMLYDKAGTKLIVCPAGRSGALEIPEGVTVIDNWALGGCSRLERVTIPRTVTAIGRMAFSGCWNKLEEIRFLGAAPSFGEWVFDGVNTTVYYPANDPSWTSVIGQTYGGRITWTPYDSDALYISSQPKSVVVSEGQTASFMVMAVGKDLSYKWYYRTSGNGDWTAVKKNGSSSTYTLVTALRHNGYQYRCQVSNTEETIWSEAATLFVRSGDIVAEGLCGDDLGWSLDSSGRLCVFGTGPMWDYEWTGQERTNAPWVDHLEQIRSLVLEEGVSTIGNEAFDGCTNLTEAQLPESLLTIGEYAFQSCGLTEINLPSRLVRTGNYAFYDCSALASVGIPAGIEKISNGCFYKCGALQEIRFDGTMAQWKDLTIESYNQAVYEALIRCSDGSIDYSGLCGQDLTWSFDAATGTLAISGSGATWPDYFPWDELRADIRKVVVGTGVTSIGGATMENGAFQDCVNLTQVSLPEGLTFLGGRSFQNCDSLTEVTLPASLTEVHQGGFGDCDSLQRILVAEGSETFTSVNGVLYSKDMTKLYICPGAKSGSFTVPDSVTAFGWRPFWGCRKLTEIRIPDTVSDLGNNTFQFCTSLKEVNIPRSATQLPISCFYGCTSLEEIVIPANITSLFGYTFTDCPSLKYVLFEGSAPGFEIGPNVFGDDTATVYYPSYDSSWYEDLRSQMGSSVTWVPYSGAPQVIRQPEAVDVKLGEKACFSVFAVGNNLGYQWYYLKPDSSSWSVVRTSGTGSSLSLTAAERHNGYQYRCKVTNSEGSVFSEVATLTIITKPVVTVQPEDVVVAAGKTASFSVTATGGALSYWWYYRTSEEGSWTAVRNNGSAATYKLTAAERHNGYQYRCKVSNSEGSVYSEIATLTVKSSLTVPVITAQPQSITAEVGVKIHFNIQADGEELSYQWYFRSSSSGSWKAVSAASGKTASYSMIPAVRHNGYQYRCKVTNSAGTVTSKTVTLTVAGAAPVIQTQPKDASVAAGGKASFTVKAVGTELSYQWQFRTGETGTWKNVSAASGKTAKYSLTAAERHNGYQYQCVVMNPQGSATSTIATLTVTPAA